MASSLPRRFGLRAPGGSLERPRGQAAVVSRKSLQRLLAWLNLPPETVQRLRAALRGKGLPPPAVQCAEGPVPVPLSQAALLQLVQKRLEPGPEWAHVPPEPQAAFRDIILREVRHAFKDLRGSLRQPGFDAQKKRHLYQNLVAYVAVVCQYLFLHYLCLLEQRGLLKVFTDHANFTRFSAQLTLDCSTFLNMEAVRQRLAMEMKTMPSLWWEAPCKTLPSLAHLSKERLGCRLGFCIGFFVRLTRPRLPTERDKVAEDIKELQSLPSLDMDKIRQLHLPTQREIALRMEMLRDTARMPCLSCLKETQPQQLGKATSAMVKRSHSLPNMRVGQLLADQLEIHIPRRSLSPDLLCHYAETSEDEHGRFRRLAEDLQRLVQGRVVKCSPWQGEPSDDLALPPLINVLTRRKANELHQEQLQRVLHGLQKEESAERKRRDTIIAASASHPQATTIEFKVNDRMVVKVADVQVSERVFLEEVSLERHPPIYNHLLGEIDNATVELLDATISTGEAVREIYKELATTISRDHLKLDAGPLIEFPPEDIHIDHSVCFASSTLTRRKGQQMINRELSNILPAGPYCPEEVVDTLQTPNLPCKKGTKKQFASWLKWWKKTFNTDDYLTYLSTRESDYLAVIFHLYDVEEEEEEKKKERPVLIQTEMKTQEEVPKEARKQAPELPAKKGKCQPGHPQSLLEEEEEGTLDVGDQESDHVKVWQAGVESLGASEYKPEDLKLLQRRLERLWVVLHFSESERLDMAMKYSSQSHYLLLPDALQDWEEAAQSIQEREVLLAELEKFELAASDPNRLLRLGLEAYATRRREDRARKRLHSELSECNSELYLILTHIKEAYGDMVTFKGRPYLKKMEWDTVEMLYWLQQERRADALSKAIQKSSCTRKLPPLG